MAEFKKAWLDSIVVDLLPIQDRSIVVDILINKLSSHPHVKIVVNLMSAHKDQSFECLGTSKKESKDMIDRLVSLYRYETEIKKIEPTYLKTHKIHVNYLPRYVLPIHSFGECELLLGVDFMKNNALSVVDEHRLSCFLFSLSIIFDRIFYAESLRDSNEKLNKANQKILLSNESLKQKVQQEVDRSTRAIEWAQKVSLQQTMNTINTAVAHEVNNPLSVMKLDAELIGSEYEENVLSFKIRQILGETLSSILKRKKILTHQGLFCDYISWEEFINEWGDKLSTDSLGLLHSLFESCRLRAFALSVDENVNRITDTLETLMKYGISGSTEKVRCDCVGLMNDVAKMVNGMCRKRGVTLNYTIQKKEAFIVADRIRLYQVFINIIKNSIEAMEYSEFKTLTISLDISDQTVSIIVEDTGLGMDNDEFYNFQKDGFTKGKKGIHMGIGLSVVNRIVSDHNGHLFFNQKSENGMLCKIQFPLSGELIGVEI